MYRDENYYWYLKSPEFKEAFLKPLSIIVNEFESCLDVGCGEGWLAEFVKTKYKGIDASEDAINKAKELYPDKEFEVARLESFNDNGQYDCIVFGGILHCLVKEDKYLDILKKYESFKPKNFVIYDLMNLDTTNIEKKYKKVYTFENEADLDIHKIKRKRKIEVYKV